MNKRFSIIAFLMLLTMTAVQAQRKHLVLIEEFTNTGCGPCATWSPQLDSCIRYRLGDCVAVKYHSGFPNKQDPFYLYDAEALKSRLDFYNVTGVPTTIVDGADLGDRSFTFLDKAITYSQMKADAHDLSVVKTLDGKHLSVSVSLKALNDVPDASRLRLFVCATEEHIEPDAAYPNGETELNYTVRKMLTPPAGHQPAATLVAGETYSYDAEWDVDFFDDLNGLGVVVFLQDIVSHEVLCTAFSGREPEKQDFMALQNLFGTPDLICTPNYYGKVIIRNNGANTITKATLNVEVNGTVKQYPWTGSLGYLERDTMVFDGFNTFQLVDAGRNDVKVWMSDVNGTSAQSNSLTTTFGNSVQATYGVQMKLYTDKKPEEITWKLYNSAGDVVREGGPYQEARKFITVPFELTADDCYLLEFLDAGGNGIKGVNGNGYYQLFQVDEQGRTKVITQGDYDGAVYDVYFRLNGAPAPEAKRLVLFEEFTNTSCAPCAEFSPALDKTINSRMGDMVAITYHYNFPSPQDPFYLACSADVMARASFYGVSGVPALRVDGELQHAWGYEDYLDLYIDGAMGKTPTMNIEAEAKLHDNELTVDVSLQPLGVADGSNLRLFVAAVEERVEWDEPAANGERSWNYVLRKLLTGGNGQQLDADLTKVTPYNYEFKWTVENYYDPTELGIVTFVQDISTGEVLNALYTPRPTGSSSAAKILSVKNTPDHICSPLFTADLVVRNTGRQTLTSANLNVSINGEVQTTPWSGHLDYLGIATLRTPAFTDFQLSTGGTNDVELWLSDLNGTTEETVHRKFTMSNAVRARNAVRLTIMTDQRPEETTWTLLNSAGDVVAQGGPYTEPRKKVIADLPLDVDDCYLIEFEDAGGDGISGDAGKGYYTLHEVNADGKTNLLLQQTYSEALHDVYFSLENAAPSAIGGVTTDEADRNGRVYDLQGRQVTPATKGIIISPTKKTVVR